MGTIIIVDYAWRGPQLGGKGDVQTRGGGGGGVERARRTTEVSFTSITFCSNACARADS